MRLQLPPVEYNTEYMQRLISQLNHLVDQSARREETRIAIADIESSVTTDVATLTASILLEATTRATADTAEATIRSAADATLTSSVSTVSASVTTETSARVTADNALASSITSLTAAYQAADTTLQSNITAEASARSSADSTETSQRTSADSTLQTNINTVNASVTTEATTRATADSALASRASALEATVDTPTTGLTARVTTAEAAIVSEGTARASADTTITSSVTTLSGTVDTKARTFRQTSAPSATAVGDLWIDSDDNEKLYRATATGTGSWVAVDDARIATTAATVATHTSTLSTHDGAIASLNTTVSSHTTSISSLNSSMSTAQADIITNASAITSANSSISTLNTTVSSHTSSISTINTTLDTKARTYAQTSAPSAVVAGELWIDTDDDNKLYRSTGSGTGNWVSVPDARIATNAANISTNTSAISTNTGAIATLNTTVSSHTTSISSINGSITTINANVSTNASAITAVDGKLTASYGVTVDGNGRLASLKLLSNGTTSDISFTADSLNIYDGTTDRPLFTAAAGRVTIDGDLNVGGSIAVGDALLKVALEPIELFQTDGDAFDWASGVDLGSTPRYILDIGALNPLASGERYDVTLTSVTSTGATLSARIMTPGSTAGQSETTDSAGGGGGAPDRVMHKPTSADAYNDIYNFTVSGNITVTSTPDSGLYVNTGTVTLTTLFNDGGGWDDGPDITIEAYEVVDYVTATDETGSHAYEVTRPITWANAIGQHGGTEFGATYVSGGSLTDLDEVTYTTQSTSGDRTACPGGELVKITAFPRNQ